MSNKDRILYLEDSAADAELVKLELTENNIDFDYLVIDTESEYRKALDEFYPDVILCDHTLPSFNSFEALRILKQKNLNIPFVVITATMTDDVAMTIVREGADDYILKDRLKRLRNVILNAIDKYRFEKDRKQTINEVYEKEAVSKEALVQLSNKLLLATKSAGMGVWDWNLVTGILSWDEGMYQLYDLSEPEMGSIYNGWLERLHPEDKHRVNEEMQLALSGEKQYDTEFRIVWKDLSVHYIKANGIVERDKLGKAVEMIGVNQDITKSKEAEQAIKESEVKYRSFFERSMDGILLTGSDGRIFAANPAACHMFQMTEEEVCKAGREGIIDVNDERVKPFLQERQRSGMAKGEIIGVRKDKTCFPIEITSTQYKDGSYSEERNSIIIRDITKRKQAEQEIIITTEALEQALGELNKIMDASVDVICSMDEEGKFYNVSKAAESIWGYKPHELIGKRYIDLVFSEDVDNTILVATDVVAGHPVTVFENRYIHKNGSIVPILWSARWDDDTKMLYCIAKDATEKKKLEKALLDERRQFYDLFLWAPTSICVLKGPDHVFEMANPLYLRLIGRKDIIGKTVKQVLPEISSQGFIELLDEVYKTGETFSGNEFLINLDYENNGKSSFVYLNFVYQAYRNEQDKIIGIFCFAIDVTEQVVSRNKIDEDEKRFRQIVETAQEGIWTIDKRNVTDFVNQKMCDMIGYAENEITGKTIQEFMEEEDRKKSYVQIERRKNGESENHDLTFITKDGKLLYTNISTNPILDSEGCYKGALAMVTDITERKAIEESNLFKAEILKNIGQSVVCIDLNGIITYCNKATERTFGWTAEEQIGKHIINYGPAEEMKEVALAGFDELFKGNSWSGELLMQRKDGTKFMAFVTDTPLVDKDNKLIGIIGIATDITERKKAEAILFEQKEQLQKANEQQTAILNALPPHIALLDNQGNIFEVNDSWLKFGRENGAKEGKSWIGQNYIEASENTEGTDRYYGNLIAENIKKIIDGEAKQFSMEYPCDSPSVKRWFNAIVSPLMNKVGEGAVVLHVDITERKLSEEKMLEMQEQLLASQSMAQIGSWHRNIVSGTEIKSNAIVCSAETLRIAGFDPDFDGMTYELFIKLTHPDDVEIVTKASETIFNGKASYYKVEHRIITPDGTVKWVCRDAKLIKDETTKQPLKIIGTIKDITIAKQQELKLEQNSRERTRLLNDLVIRNKSLEQFAYIVSHNLRAPVANILGIAGMMVEPNLITEDRDQLNNGIIESVAKLDTVIRDLNHILQVKKEHKELEETVHFSTFVKDIKVSIKHIIADDIHISYDFSEVNELFTIRSYIYSIFYNLILNSIKYRRQQVPCVITIKSRLVNNSIIILFTDNGMGIDLTLRGEDVFGLYKRFHTNIEGKGMGLYMVKTQVEAIGGRISIDSEVNKGTTFKIVFEL